MLGIPLHAWGSTAKLWAEAIENIPPDRWRRRPPTLRVKVLAFNFRASTVLGVVGAQARIPSEGRT